MTASSASRPSTTTPRRPARGRRDRRRRAGGALHAHAARRTSFPRRRSRYCLERGRHHGRASSTYVCFYDKPLEEVRPHPRDVLRLRAARLPLVHAGHPPLAREKLHTPREIRKGLDGVPGQAHLHRPPRVARGQRLLPLALRGGGDPHLDGVGEWATTTWGVGAGNRIDSSRGISFPHSLGLLYSAFTYFTGFKVNSGEYKLMGLAPYGEPVYADVIKEKLIDIKPDGSYRLEHGVLHLPVRAPDDGREVRALFGGPPRTPESADHASARWTSPPRSRP